MHLIDHIFEVLGEATAIANATGDPVQTVHSWKANKSIPPWRRRSLLGLKPVKDKAFTQEAIAYLQSSERKPVGVGTESAAA